MKRSILGILVIMESLFMGLTAVVSLIYRDGGWPWYAGIAVGAAVLGYALKLSGGRDSRHHLTRADSFLVVTISWVVFSLIGMLPYIALGGMGVSEAFFETMSGFTTTGATCMTDIDSQPQALLFWRALTQWIGGLGIVVFSFALIPVYELKNTNIYSAEVTGIGVDRLTPKIGATARRIFVSYITLTAACTLCYWLGPMGVYDSVCHSLATVSTGGFSTHTASVAYFHSSYIEYVAIFFMLVSGFNFSVYYYMTIRNKNAILRNEELRTYVGIVLVAVVVFVGLFMSPAVSGAAPGTLPCGPEETLRSSLFHVVSIISSTGFAAQKFDYMAWGSAFLMPTMMLMAVGACAGSTSGGIKVVRAIICVKSILNEFILQLHPRAVLGVRVSGQIVSPAMVRRTLAFVCIYVTLVALAVLLHPLIGHDMDTAMGSSISMLSNVGPGIGATGPAGSFACVPAAGKWLLSFYMLVGRLEIFTVLFLFIPHYWNERK